LANSPQDAKWLTLAQRDWLLQTLRNEEQSAEFSSSRPYTVLFLGRVWILSLIYFGLNTVSYGISLWLPNLLKNASGADNLTIGILSSIPYLLAAVAMVLVGLHSDKKGERRWHLAISAFVGAAGMAAAAYSGSTVLLVITICVAAMGVQSMVGPFWAIPTTLLGTSTAAIGIAVINSIGNLGGGFGSSIIGVIRRATGSYRGGLLVLAATLGIAGCLALGVRFRK
jgi:ACS family tartrate transporter-like MFS transporter